MKKIIIIVLALVLAASPALAAKKIKTEGDDTSASEIRFRDVPQSHWAAKAVYKLVSLGVTQGYPDGTFRGTKTITRFETALFLAKLAESMGSAGMEKLGAEMKSEMKAMRDEMDDKFSFAVSGTFESTYFIGNLLTTKGPSGKAPQGPVTDWRLITTLATTPRNDQSFAITLDTMDGGYFGGSQEVLSKLIDVEAKFRPDPLSPLLITATVGPGPQQHIYNSPVMRSEYGKTYVRPYTGIKLSSSFLGADMDLGYFAHNIQTGDPVTPGLIGVGETVADLGWSYDNMFLLGKGTMAFRGDYFVQNTTAATALTNFKPSFTLVSSPVNGLSVKEQVKFASVHGIDSHKTALITDISMSDVLNTDTDVDLNVTIAGSDYIAEPVNLDEWTLLGYDPFMRPRTNDARAFSLAAGRCVSDILSLSLKGNLNLSPDYKFGLGAAGSGYTLEAGMGLKIAQDGNVYAGYRIDNDPNAADQTTDLLILTASYSY